MSSSIIQPPANILGMKVLDKDAFRKSFELQCIRIPTTSPQQIGQLVKALKRYVLPLRKSRGEKRDDEDAYREMLLDPERIVSWESFSENDRKILESAGLNESSLFRKQVEFSYDNFDAEEVLRGVLGGDDVPYVAGFSRVGHIIHLNLRAEHEPYKRLIGQVLLDKTAMVRTVINKTTNIESEFRNISYELLAGEDDMIADVKENGCSFRMDYGKVYWNPRLGSEHENLVKLLNPETILYDVFAGIGPFAIPAAKKKCQVLANDLNPSSVEWLKINIKTNKVVEKVIPFCLDARDFIQTVVKDDLAKRFTENPDSDLRFVMNLPASAEEFLNEFNGLLHGKLNDELQRKFREPKVYLYCFHKSNSGIFTQADELSPLERVKKHLGYDLKEDFVIQHNVRKVAPNKDMLRLEFPLPRELLTKSKTC